MPEKESLCNDCRWAKDKWHDAYYCVYYGYIVSRAKKECWGYEPRKEEKEYE